jgi:uncharacterized membrane protein YeaQ/YmgE (transglycosylase-associated protein family)
MGPLGSVIVGVVGSLVGGFLFAAFGLRLLGLASTYIFSLLASIVGAVVALLLVRLVRRLTP